MVNGIGLLLVAIAVVVFAMHVYETKRQILDLQEGVINLWEQASRIREIEQRFEMSLVDIDHTKQEVKILKYVNL